MRLGLGLGLDAGFTMDPDVAKFIAAAGITNPTQVGALMYLVNRAKYVNGWWNLCDVIYPIIGGNPTAHSKNLKNPAVAVVTWTGSTVHSATGCGTDGTTGFGNAAYNPTTFGGVLVQDSMHMSWYCTSAIAQNAAASAVPCGWGGGPYTSDRYTTGNHQLSMNSAVGISNSAFGTVGFMAVTRTAAGAAAFMCNTNYAVNASASTARPNSNMYLLCEDNGGLWLPLASSTLIGGFTAGSGMSQAQLDAMRLDWDQYQSQQGRIPF